MAHQPHENEHDSPRALLVGPRTGAHHFASVGSTLRSAGWFVQSETFQRFAPVSVRPEMVRSASVILHADANPKNSVVLRNDAQRFAVPIALMMDGVLEYANTFLNASAGDRFLRAAPADMVLASGCHDRAILEALGNRSIATGLPRLDRYIASFVDEVGTAEPDGLLVATANQPWFTPGARCRLMDSLKDIRRSADRSATRVRWRVSAEIASELGVEPDRTPLAHSMARVRAVITSASTLAIEGMLAIKPTAILHPHPWPLWIPCGVCYTGRSETGLNEDQDAMKALRGIDAQANNAAAASIQSLLAGDSRTDFQLPDQLIEALLAKDRGLEALQQRIIERGFCQNAPTKVVEALSSAASIGLERGDDSGSEAHDTQSRAEPTTRRSASDWLADQPLAVRSALAAYGDTHAEPELRASPEHQDDLLKHINAILELANATSRIGTVRSTLPDGLCPGLECVSRDQVFSGQRPEMLLLAGDEYDFGLYRRARQWRESGTRVHSLGWRDEELRSPERFETVVNTLAGAPYAIFGAGLHTNRLLEHATPPTPPSLIIDDAAEDGDSLFGIPIVLPEHRAIGSLSAIVISSTLHEQKLLERARGLGHDGLRCIPLYQHSGSPAPAEDFSGVQQSGS